MTISAYPQAHYCEGDKDNLFTKTALTLQTLEPHADPESGAHDASQYAVVYQALDPKSLD